MCWRIRKLLSQQKVFKILSKLSQFLEVLEKTEIKYIKNIFWIFGGIRKGKIQVRTKKIKISQNI